MTLRLARKHVPIAATTIVCLLLYAAACLRYRDPAFFSATVFLNFFQDNAFLGLAAIGMTFVILSGGIDLSVGALIGLTSILLAALVTRAHVHPLMAIPLVLATGAAFGTGMGCLIHFFRLPPFLITLAGMFLARGLGFVVSLEAITISHASYAALANFSLEIFPVTALIFIGALLIALYLAHYTRFGRAVYAIGGSPPGSDAARLMGLPVGATRVKIYALSGFCAALGGVVSTFYFSSGNATTGTMLELDAIAAVVIGGTLLSGGVGYVFGTLIGVLIYGIIQTAIAFEGTLSSWWTRIVVGVLLLAFILMQKLVQRRAAGRRG